MTRAAAMTVVSALCLFWTAGCASTSAPGSNAAPTASKTANVAPDAANLAPDAQANLMPDARDDVATLAKTLPGSVDGEIRRAELLRAKGDYDEAARSFAQLLLVEPDDARIVGAYGKVLEQQGHSKEALPFLKRAVQLSPNDWTVQSALGVAYDQVDDHVSAKAAYERALVLKPAEGSVLNNYAVSRMLAGDYAGAKRLFAEAEANGAANPKIAGNLEKLATLAPQPTPQPAPAPVAPQHTTQAAVQPPAPAVVTKANAVMAAAPQASHAPMPVMAQDMPVVAKDSHPTPPVHVAVAAPKALGGQVVMQSVPHDPLAGPVHHAAVPTLASNAKKPPQPANKKPAAETPSLRTAADTN